MSTMHPLDLAIFCSHLLNFRGGNWGGPERPVLGHALARRARQVCALGGLERAPAPGTPMLVPLAGGLARARSGARVIRPPSPLQQEPTRARPGQARLAHQS